MHIDTILLILESVLLVFTIVLLFYSIREGKERKFLLLEVGKATKILTRLEYFLSVADSMMEAKEEVIGCITGSHPSQEDMKRTGQIVENIRTLTAAGVKVQYLIPKFPDRLFIGHLYSKGGAIVRYTSCLIVHDIRYIVVDERLVVMGVPESIGEQEATRKGFRVPSEGLAMILKDHYLKCHDGTIGYEDYVKEIIKQTGASAKMLSKELHIDVQELERLGAK